MLRKNQITQYLVKRFTSKTIPYNLPAQQLKILSISFSCAIVILAIFFGLKHSLIISIDHVDGAYQTASGLFRLHNGQLPGRDFYPYLGVGLLYFLYPVFFVAGAKISASLFAAHFVTILSSAFIAGLITFLFVKSNRSFYSAFAGFIFIAISSAASPYLPNIIMNSILPGNSLRPLRSLIPYFDVALIYLVINYYRAKPKIIYSTIGALAGISILWSNDFGIASTAALGLLTLIYSYQNHQLSFKNLSLTAISAIITFAILITIATHGHAIEMLKYNFLDVRGDQYWYFSPWEADNRILSIRDFIIKFPQCCGLGWPILIIIIAITYLYPTIENLLLFTLAIALLCGGTLLIVGGHINDGYFDPFKFLCFVLTILWIIRYKKYRLPNFDLKIFLMLILATTSAAAYDYYCSRDKLAHDQSKIFIPELGGYLPAEWNNFLEVARQSKDQVVLEEYWGVWSAFNNKNADTPVDSVIHALGSTRDIYENKIKEFPEIVITTARSHTVSWQSWGLSANWWFHRYLLKNYQPKKISPAIIMWTKSEEISWPEIPCFVDNQNGKSSSFTIAAKSASLYEITLKYRNKGLSSRSLVLANNNLNFASSPLGYVSLNIAENSTTFPVFVFRTKENNFDFRLVSDNDDFSNFELQSCEARKINFEHPDVFMSSDQYPHAVTKYRHN